MTMSHRALVVLVWSFVALLSLWMASPSAGQQGPFSSASAFVRTTGITRDSFTGGDVFAEVVSNPTNLARARVSHVPQPISLTGASMDVGVEVRAGGGTSRNSVAHARFLDHWVCTSTAVCSNLGTAAAQARIRLHGVIDASFLQPPPGPGIGAIHFMTIQYSAGSGSNGFLLLFSLCPVVECGRARAIQATVQHGTVRQDVTNQIVFGKNALGEDTLILNFPPTSSPPFSGFTFGPGPWNESIQVDASINSNTSTLNHLLDFLNSMTVEITSATPGVVWVSASGRVVAGVVPFAKLEVKKLEIEAHAFEISGSFALGAGSSGIDPVAQDVTLQLGSYMGTIPAGSFMRDGKRTFKFEGVVAGVALQMEIRPKRDGTFEFKAEGEGVNLNGTADPVTVGLRIGGNGGTTAVSVSREKD